MTFDYRNHPLGSPEWDAHYKKQREFEDRVAPDITGSMFKWTCPKCGYTNENMDAWELYGMGDDGCEDSCMECDHTQNFSLVWPDPYVTAIMPDESR